MDLEHLQGYILIVLIFAVAALGVWYLAVRFNQRRLKIIAVMLVVFPLLAIGLGIASSVFDLGVSSEFNDTAVGPARGEASVTREFPFQVNDETALQDPIAFLDELAKTSPKKVERRYIASPPAPSKIAASLGGIRAPTPHGVITPVRAKHHR